MRIEELFRRSDEWCRREFMARAAHGLLAVGAMPLFAGSAVARKPGRGAAQDPGDRIPLQPATARNVIYLYLSGGISHIDTFDTKPGAPTQGPIETIGTAADGVRISQYFPLLARQMDKVCVINSMHSTQGAHAQGRYFMHTSYPLRGTIRHPSLGAWLNRMAGRTNEALPGHVGIGLGPEMASAGFLESRYAPLPIGDPAAGLQDAERHPAVDDERMAHRLARLEEMNRAFRSEFDHRQVRGYDDMYQEALRLMQSEDLEAFDTGREPQDLRDAYGDDRFGQGCLLARRLVEHNVRFVEVVSGGWDTHNENFEAMEDQCPDLDRALAALLADLDVRGMLEETLVVVATEFGRTPEITATRNGRDHWPKAFSCLLAGGGIAGGRRYGRTDARGAEVVEDPVSIPDFNATIAHALGLPTDHVIQSPSGRPFTVADKGEPVRALFA